MNPYNIKKIKDIPDKVWAALRSKQGIRRVDLMLDYEYGKKVLEIGPGRGFLAIAICKSKNNIESYTGLELSEKFRKHCEAMSTINHVDKASFIRGDGSNMSEIDNSSYDTVVAAEVLEHLRDPLPMLKEIYRVLNKGGKCIISVPSQGAMPPGKTPGHVQDFSVNEMLNLIKQAGLELINHKQEYPWEFYLTLKL